MPVVDTVQFDGAVDYDVQESRELAFIDQRHVLRESLQKRSADQLLEIFFAHILEQWERADSFPVGLTQRTLLNFAVFFAGRCPCRTLYVEHDRGETGLININRK